MASKSKKIVALILTAMMATAALAGCGGGKKEPSKSGGTTSGASTASQASGSDDDDDEGEIIDITKEETLSVIKEEMKKEAVDGTVSLKVWCASTDLAFEKTIAEEFAQKFSGNGLTVKVDVRGTIGEDAAGGKIIESPEDGADVFNFADDQLSSLVEADDIAAVSGYLKKTVKSGNTTDSVAICTVDDEMYAYPKTSDNGYFMYYDKRVFKDDEVGNLDEMIAKAKAANKKVFIDLGNAWYNTGFFFAAGCKVEYKGGVQTAEFGNENGLKAAKAMCQIAESEGSGYEGTPGTMGDNAYVKQGFETGELAAAVIGTWEGPDIKKAIGEQNVGAAKLPTVLMDGKQEQLHSFGGYKLVGVNKYSKSQFSAHMLAYYLTNTESQLKRYGTRGLIPTNQKAIDGEIDGKKVKDDPALKAITDQQPYAHPQGASVSGKYWASNVGGFGGEIVTNKGKMDDATLNSKLKALEAQMKD